MAKESTKYPEHFSVVATKAQKDALKVAARRHRLSVAEELRRLVDRAFGLVDGEIPEE